MLNFDNIDWSATAEFAQQHYETLVAAKPGHKMPAWEGLPPLLRADLILRAALRSPGAANDRS